MMLVLSPSKTLDYETPVKLAAHTQPDMLGESQALIKELRKYTPKKLSGLMDISDKLANLNAQRYKAFATPFTQKNARQAILAFKGDVYDGIDVERYSKEDFAFAQEHVRILSGLYGLLRPLDLMQPYRLEMSIGLKNPRGKDLYAFWDESITRSINQALATHKNKLLINLASEEYAKAIKTKILEQKQLNIVFKENQKGQLKIIGLFAKKARGLMANYIIKNQIDNAETLKKFKESGYGFEPSLSDETRYVFVR
jgi:cytoplasmic iron level regulating protein YaaA (DUF328/UPF0246 family)